MGVPGGGWAGQIVRTMRPRDASTSRLALRTSPPTGSTTTSTSRPSRSFTNHLVEAQVSGVLDPSPRGDRAGDAGGAQRAGDRREGGGQTAGHSVHQHTLPLPQVCHPRERQIGGGGVRQRRDGLRGIYVDALRETVIFASASVTEA
jgi:hypothetical protein